MNSQRAKSMAHGAKWEEHKQTKDLQDPPSGRASPIIEDGFGETIPIHGTEAAAGMDMKKIKQEFGKDLVLTGNVDANEVLCQSDLEIVRKEVDRCLEEGMEGGGFVLSSAGSAHEGVHPEALVEMCRYQQVVGVYR